jgi:hypothetical protein
MFMNIYTILCAKRNKLLGRRKPAILLLRNSTAKGAKKHEKAKYAASKYRENIQI